jgi:hypothetical protein
MEIKLAQQNQMMQPAAPAAVQPRWGSGFDQPAKKVTQFPP